MRPAERGIKYPVTLSVKISRQLATRVSMAAKRNGMQTGQYLREVISAASEEEEAVPVRVVLEELMSIKKIIVTLARPEWKVGYGQENYERLMKESSDLKAEAMADGRLDIYKRAKELRIERIREALKGLEHV